MGYQKKILYLILLVILSGIVYACGSRYEEVDGKEFVNVNESAEMNKKESDNIHEPTESTDISRDVRWTNHNYLWEEQGTLYYTFNGEVGILSENGEILEKLVIQNDYRQFDAYDTDWMISDQIIYINGYLYWCIRGYEAEGDTVYRIKPDGTGLEKAFSFVTVGVSGAYCSGIGAINGKLCVSSDIDGGTFRVTEDSELMSEGENVVCHIGVLEEFDYFPIEYADSDYLYYDLWRRKYTAEWEAYIIKDTSLVCFSSEGYVFYERERAGNNIEDTVYHLGFCPWDTGKVNYFYNSKDFAFRVEIYDNKIFVGIYPENSWEEGYVYVFDLNGNILGEAKFHGSNDEWEVQNGKIWWFNRNYKEIEGRQYGIADVKVVEIDYYKDMVP